MQSAELAARPEVGLLLRTFAKQRTDLESRVSMTLALVKKALELNDAAGPVFGRIDILVFANRSYDDRDCGLLEPELSAALAREGAKRVNLHRIETGDLYCGALNYGIAAQHSSGVVDSFIWSPDAHTQFTAGNVLRMLKCRRRGDVACGLALPELGPAAWDGRIANSAIVWSTRMLTFVGGFDPLSALHPDKEQQVFVTGRSGQSYPLAGVEEMIPLARLYRFWGQRIGVVLPEDESARYAIPSDPELRQRHDAKFASKRERQGLMLERAGFEEDALKGIVAHAIQD